MSKINKLGKSTFVIAILSFILVAVLAFGGTYAYFSDTSNEVTSGTITLGTLVIDENLAFAETASLKTEGYAVPAETVIDGDVETHVNSNINYYVRAIITVEFAKAAGHTCVEADAQTGVRGTSCSDADKAFETNGKAILYTISADDGAIMGSDVDAEDTMSQKWFTVEGAAGTTYLYLADVQTASSDFALDINAYVNPEVGDDESQHLMGATFAVTITFQVCQADYVVDASTPGAKLTPETVANSAWKSFN